MAFVSGYDCAQMHKYKGNGNSYFGGH
jgi:hypothetical protein